tara:strand:- start:7595 stop:7774 length:180 start_codon:yes stop_codon:yes gene_type:complete
VFKAFKLIWILFLTIIGGIAGAILLGGFSSISLSTIGAIIGLPVGYFLGKYISIYEWFT